MEIPYSGTAQRPPILDASNYAIWKVRMRVYIKSIDEKAWHRVLQGWNPPRRTDGEGDFLIKPETDWNAWEKLQMHYEGSESVRRTKRRILTTQFENLRMEESETIDDYERRLRKIKNETIDLGDAISNERLVSKVLRSLPERFQMKICAIDESKDTSILGLDELMSSLRTYELEMNFGKKDKGKSIALQVSNDSYNDFVDLTQGVNESNLGDDFIALLTKQFGNYLKKIRDYKKPGQKPKVLNAPAVGKPLRICGPEQNTIPSKSQNQFQKEGKTLNISKKFESVKCHECTGFGHYANECPTRLRKGMYVSLSDDEDEEVPKDSNNQDADEEELSLENAQKMYEEFYTDWMLRYKSNSILSKENSELKASVARLEVVLSKKDLELCKVKEDLGRANATLAKFNSSKTKLDSILMMGKDDRAGLGFIIASLKQVLPTLHQNTAWKKNSEKKVWVPKTKSSCNVVYTSLKTNVAGSRSSDNCYQLGEDFACKFTKVDDLNFWYQKLGHANFKALKKLSQYDAVRGMPNLTSGVPYVCGDCQKEVESCGGKRYSFVCVDDFSRYSWEDISHEYSAPKTPQQNDIAERKNRTLQEMARVMMELTKFDSKSDKCLFLGYALNSRASRVFNLRTRTIIEYINVIFDDYADLKGKTIEDNIDDLLDTVIPQTDSSVVTSVVSP
ncbi:uncharacterized protein [Henckelia pumila]|uniref:uncharacterized protein n=1 Tax=Henckelia pumila TaxID=405737 RepID=UPI003C6E6DA4